MAQCTVGKLLAVALALVFPLSMIAADARGAMVYATSGVSVNGASVERSGAVFAGDKVQVPTQSTAAITAPGNQLVLAAGSTLTYAAESLALDDGSGVAVTTTRGMTVEIGKLIVKPAASSTTKYEVARAGGEVSVRALDGPVQVYDGTSTLMTVAAGSTMTMPDPASQETPPTAGSSKAGLSLAILIGLVVAGAATVTVIETTKCGQCAPASPHSP